MEQRLLEKTVIYEELDQVAQAMPTIHGSAGYPWGSFAPLEGAFICPVAELDPHLPDVQGPLVIELSPDGQALELEAA